MPAHIAVIDPGTKHGELDAFNQLSLRLPLSFSYHQVVSQGFATLDLAAKASPIGGVVVFGSGATVSDKEPWQEPLQQRLLAWLDRGVPTLAICYGLQLMGDALGGSLAYVTEDKVKLKGRREITVAAHPIFGAKPQRGEVIVSHNQCLRVPPPSVEVISHNKDYDFVEMFVHQTKPLVAIQAHPEAGEQFVEGNEVPVTCDDPSNFKFGTHIVDSFFHHYFGSSF